MQQNRATRPPSIGGADSSLRFIDLFAGLGGFHVAMESLGAECVFAAEWEPSLQQLYQRNFGVVPAGDITKVPVDEVPDHDVLCAGFPCQPFSKAGEQLGFEHTEQGQLFFDVKKILIARMPRYFILENVPNLLKHDGGKTFERIIAELEELGYAVDHHRLSPHQFSIPQVRDRLYIVGSLEGLEEFAWPVSTNAPTSIRSVLGHGVGKPLSPEVMRVLETWDGFLKSMPADVDVPSFPLWAMEFGATYPFEDASPRGLTNRGGSAALAKYRGSFGRSLRNLSVDDQFAAMPSHVDRPGDQFPHWKKLFIRQNRAFFEANRSWISPWLPTIKTFPSSFQKFEWNAKGEERTVWKYVIQLRASGVRVKRPTTAPSLIAMTDTQVPIIAWERRYMTPAECAHLQSLGSIDLPEHPTKAFRALGNAVNARVVEAILERLTMRSPAKQLRPVRKAA